MSIFSKTGLIADITDNIYTNVQRLIKGNTLKARLLNIVDSTFIRVLDTAANFTANNPILANGEIGIESDSLTTSPKFKIGNGITHWNSLHYISVVDQTVVDTAANFTANNPTLNLGQLGIESDDLVTVPLFKIGDGVNDWSVLPYANAGGGGGSQTLAQTLALGALTNQIDITSNDGDSKARVNNNDVRLEYSPPYMGAAFNGIRASSGQVWIYFQDSSSAYSWLKFLTANAELRHSDLINLTAPITEVSGNLQVNGSIISSNQETEVAITDTNFLIAFGQISGIGGSVKANASSTKLDHVGTIEEGNIIINDSTNKVYHTVKIDLNAPSVQKNGVEVATLSDIPSLTGYVKKGTLTTNTIQKATSSDTIGNSNITDDGVNINISYLTASQIVETDASKNLVSAAKGTAYNKDFGTGTANIVEIGSTLSNSQITSTDANGKLQTLTTATYPSLTELSYGKGVTSAIQTQLNAKLSETTGAFIKSLIKQNTTISHTGTTSETKLYSVLIPSGTMNANDILEYYAWIIPGIGSGNKTVKVYLNTSNAIGGIQIATYTFLTTSAILKRKITFKNSLSTQEIIPAGATNLGNAEVSTYASSNVSSIAANFNNDVWFVISMTLATGTDNVSIYSIGSNILR